MPEEIIRNIEGELRSASDGIAKLSEQQAKFGDKLNKTMDEGAKKINVFTSAVESLTKNIGVTSGALEKLVNPLALISDEFGKVIERIDRVTEVSIGFGDAMGKATKSAQKQAMELGIEWSELRDAQNVLMEGTTISASTMETMSKEMGILSKSTNMSASSIAEFTTQAIGFNKTMSPKDVHNIAEEFNQVRNRVGLSADQMEKLMGGTTEAVDKFSMFGRGTNKKVLQNYAKGLGEVTGMYKKMGLSVDDAIKKVNDLLDPDQFEDNAFMISQMGISYGEYVEMLEGGDAEAVMSKMSGGMKDIADKAKDMSFFQKKAYADSLGMSVKELTRLGNMTEEEFASTESSTENMGETLEKKMLKNMETFQTQITRIQETFAQLATDLIEKVGPFLKQVAKDFLAVADVVRDKVFPIFEAMFGFLSDHKGAFGWVAIAVLSLGALWNIASKIVKGITAIANIIPKLVKSSADMMNKAPEGISKAGGKIDLKAIGKAIVTVVAVIALVMVLSFAIKTFMDAVGPGLFEQVMEFVKVSAAMTLLSVIVIAMVLVLSGMGAIIQNLIQYAAIGVAAFVVMIGLIGAVSWAISAFMGGTFPGVSVKGSELIGGVSEFLKLSVAMLLISLTAIGIMGSLVALGALSMAIVLAGLGVTVFLAVLAGVSTMAVKMKEFFAKEGSEIVRSVSDFSKMTKAMKEIARNTKPLVMLMKDLKKVLKDEEEIRMAALRFNNFLNILVGRGEGSSLLSALESLGKTDLPYENLTKVMQSLSTLVEVMGSLKDFVGGPLSLVSNKISDALGNLPMFQGGDPITRMLSKISDMMSNKELLKISGGANVAKMQAVGKVFKAIGEWKGGLDSLEKLEEIDAGDVISGLNSVQKVFAKLGSLDAASLTETGKKGGITASQNVREISTVLKEISGWSSAVKVMGEMEDAFDSADDSMGDLSSFFFKIEKVNVGDLKTKVRTIGNLLSDVRKWGEGGEVSLVGGKVEFTMKPNKGLEMQLYGANDSIKSEISKINSNLDKYLGTADGRESMKQLMQYVRDSEAWKMENGAGYGSRT